MQLARILLVFAALAVIDTEANWFRFPIAFPASFSSLLPFTFNITSDDSNLGSITLNVKPKFTREIAGAKVKREVSDETAEKLSRLNSKDSRLFRPLTEKWEMGLPSGLGLTLGAVGSVAGVIWTVIAKNLEYKKEHGELDWKDSPGNAPIPAPPAPPAPPALPAPPYPPAPSYGSYNAPSYSSDYSIPPHQKPEKGFDGFKFKGIKEMQAQAMKGLTRLVGLRDLDSLLHPRPKKLKKKKRPMQQQYYAQPVYQSSYTYPQEYAPQPSYDPAPVYAPPPSYDPSPAYSSPPAYNPVPAYAPPPAEPPSDAPPPQDSAPTPQLAPAPEPAPVSPPVIAQVNVLPLPYAPPTQYYPINYVQPPSSRGINDSPTQTAQQWNGPSVSSSQSDSLPPQITDSAPVDDSKPVVDSTPVVPPPSYISIQTNGFLPIFPSPVDPLPFEPSPDQTPQMPESTGNVPTFGVAPSPLPPSSAPSPPAPAPYAPSLPPRGSRLDDSQPINPSLSATEDSSSQSTATSAATSAVTSATTSVVTPIAEEHLEMDDTEGPQYSIMDESTPADTSVTNSSVPYGQRLNSANRIATL